MRLSERPIGSALINARNAMLATLLEIGTTTAYYTEFFQGVQIVIFYDKNQKLVIF